VDFRILGPLEVSRDGRPVAVGGQRQKALLCLLLLHANEVVSADRLVDELWRGAPSATAGKALQVYVSRLRKALGADALETRAPGYRIRIEDGALDLWRFERLAGEGTHALAAGDPARASASLQKALALWRGPAIADVMYEPFAQAEAARLEELRLSCLEDRLEADLALGHHAGVVGELEALVDRHRSRERLRGQLMLALYRSGRQAEALEIYRETRRTLVEELGIQPGPELQSLEREILNQDPRLTWMPPHITAAKPSRPAGVFVGREHELAEFVGALGDLEHGRGSLFLVSGEPGIGKSRLAEEAAALAAERGARVLSGRAWEFGGAPAYWPWVQCLRALVRDADPATLTAQLGAGAADVAQVLPELGESFPDLSPAPSADPEGARFRLFDAVATFVRNAARAKPMVLVLEDLHAADAPSLLLLQFVAAELADARVLVIATWRDGDRAANAAFGPILAALARNERFHQMALGGLRPEEVTRLVEVTGGIEASEEVVAAIHARTDGHPFFVTELARLLASRGRHDGLPRGVRAVVAQRLGLLSEDCRRVLAVASVVGREFRADVLATASELDGAALLDLLSEAVAAKSLLELPGASGRFRVAHALVAEVLYDELAPDRRIRLHRQVGEALEAIHAAEPEQHLAELARHFAAAAPIGTVPQAVDYATRAAERATRELAYEEAARLYELALVAHELAPGADTAARCNLLLALGDMQARANDMVSAKETFLRAADVARGSGMADRLAHAALGYGGRFVMLPEDDPRIVPLLEEALAALGDDEGALRARLLARLSCARNNPPRSLEAVELARRVGDPATLVWALEARSVLLWGLDNLDEMLDLSEEVIALAGGAQAWESALNTHLQRQELLLTLGRTQEARADVDAAARLASELRLPSAHWHVAVHEVELALLAGRFAEAQALIDTARRLGEQASTDEVTINAVTQRFALLRERGGLDELRPALQRIAADYPDEAVYRCLLARLEWDTGHEDEARAMFELLARDRCAAVHRGLEWLLAITLLAEMAVDLEGVAHAEMLYELLTPYPSLVTVGPHFFHMGSTARALGILAALLSRPDEAIRHLEAAAAINERIGARPWLAHTKADHARVLLTRGAPGDPDRADDLLRHALAVYRELGMTASEHKLSSLLGDPTVV
jgi:DNA-binding SARP family transcriptional activator